LKASALVLFLVTPGSMLAQTLNVPWNGYGHDAQHTANSANASQALNRIHWASPVDLNKPDGELFIHYGSPMVTAANTVLVPVKLWTGTTDGFKVQAFAGGVPLYTLTTDYSLPPHNWTPSYSPTLNLRNRVYYAGAGGTVYYRDQVDSPTGSNGQAGATGQIAFYGNAEYASNMATYNSAVQISTPLVSDRYGDIYFGFVVTGPNPKNLVSGVARITITGAGSWVSARAVSGGDFTITQVPLNCAPALSNDHRTLYFAVVGTTPNSYLISVNSTTLAPTGRALLLDPRGSGAAVSLDSSASPMVGPDDDVYYGVLENPCCSSHNDRGWLLHFDATLAHAKTTGSFGWDTTPSVVPRNLVAGYAGASSYLILTKYNNYIGSGSGDGINKVAVLDPNATMADPVIPSVSVMKEVMTVTGVTPDGAAPAVKEWCINSAAIDPFTRSAIVNSEDGTVYRWDFASGSLTQRVSLNAPIGEAYTPTVIGPDGTIYVINDAILYALGN
jgi:hypothetical protein